MRRQKGEGDRDRDKERTNRQTDRRVEPGYRSSFGMEMTAEIPFLAVGVKIPQGQASLKSHWASLSKVPLGKSLKIFSWLYSQQMLLTSKAYCESFTVCRSSKCIFSVFYDLSVQGFGGSKGQERFVAMLRHALCLSCLMLIILAAETIHVPYFLPPRPSYIYLRHSARHLLT